MGKFRRPFLFFIFIPWSAFLDKAANIEKLNFKKARVHVGTSCEKPVTTFRTVLAVTSEARTKGFSKRRAPLNGNESMLFVFVPDQRANFWMKETYIPLQLAYFDRNGKMVQKFNLPVEVDPLNPVALYSSEKPVSAALEVAPTQLNALPLGSQLCVEI